MFTPITFVSGVYAILRQVFLIVYYPTIGLINSFVKYFDVSIKIC